MSNTSTYFIKSFLWGGIAVTIDALIKFLSIPLLLTYFGKENFGLITLATSINAYLQLLDMGVNTGSIKHFSEWIGANKLNLVNKVARTSISFYGIIGFLNALILLSIASWGMHIFALTQSQAQIMQNLFFILSIVAIINWSTSVFNQLLIANENISYVQQIKILRSIFVLFVIYLTIKLKFNLTVYFILFSFVNSLVLIPYYLKSKKNKLIGKFVPAFYWKDFKVILHYSMAIIAIGLFSMTASKMRPIILGIFSNNGIGIVVDYRILDTITTFIILLGGMFISIFLPKTSKILSKNDKSEIARFAYKATLYTSTICVILCIPFILNANELLILYVGPSYSHLSKWLILWSITILFYLHNTPIASLVLSTGKTRMLVYSSAISCIISLLINASLCKMFGAGSAVIGYSIYIIIQMSFYYLYFNNKILQLNSFQVFKSFILPVIIGSISAIPFLLIHFQIDNLFILIILKSLLWIFIYLLILFITNIISLRSSIMIIKGLMTRQ